MLQFAASTTKAVFVYPCCTQHWAETGLSMTCGGEIEPKAIAFLATVFVHGALLLASFTYVIKRRCSPHATARCV